MANITWVPSKKAVEEGSALPEGISASFFDLDTAKIPEASSTIMLTRAYRHMLNNEAASAWLAEKGRRDEKNEDTSPAARLDYVHAWRVGKRDDILNGKLGMREASEPVVTDPVELEAKLIAFGKVRAHVLNQNGNFPYTVMNARSLAFDVQGKKVSDWIAALIDPATPRGAKIWADAKENVDKRNASVNDGDLGDIFANAAE